MLTPDEAASHEPQLDNDRWRDVINEPAGSGGGGRRKPPPSKPYASSLDRPDDPVERRRPSTKPSDVVRWGSKGMEQQFGPLLEQLDDLHQVPDDLPTMLARYGKPEGGTGGQFTVRRGKMTLEVMDRQDGTEALSFLHEFGHRVDYTGEYSFFSQGGHGQRDFLEALKDWNLAVVDTPTITTAARRYGLDRTYLRYYMQPEEIWARAYSQWAANRLGGDALDALIAARAGVDPLFQWPNDEFERLTPLLERVLRARGLLE